ncbi:hypothetical protein pipiens_012216 [Culex pipiens pipiens]|uniref:Uncharacterized protein n=1 Tax=Culex pipiens pipiens TaxID=38569 RepID=A0ABD1D6A0_CULPP
MLPPQGGNRRLLDLPVDAEPIIGQDLVMWLPMVELLTEVCVMALRTGVDVLKNYAKDVKGKFRHAIQTYTNNAPVRTTWSTDDGWNKSTPATPSLIACSEILGPESAPAGTSPMTESARRDSGFQTAKSS